MKMASMGLPIQTCTLYANRIQLWAKTCRFFFACSKNVIFPPSVIEYLCGLGSLNTIGIA